MRRLVVALAALLAAALLLTCIQPFAPAGPSGNGNQPNGAPLDSFPQETN